MSTVKPKDLLGKVLREDALDEKGKVSVKKKTELSKTVVDKLFKDKVAAIKVEPVISKR